MNVTKRMPMPRDRVWVGECNDAFSFRHGERLWLRPNEIRDVDEYAFMVADITPLPAPAAVTSGGGELVVPSCIVAAERVNGIWQWMQLAPDSKAVVGDTILNNGLERNVWHGAFIGTGDAGDSVAVWWEHRSAVRTDINPKDGQ